MAANLDASGDLVQPGQSTGLRERSRRDRKGGLESTGCREGAELRDEAVTLVTDVEGVPLEVDVQVGLDLQ